MSLERIQKLLAQSGIASRRKIEHLIKERRININNKSVETFGLKVSFKKDNIQIDNQSINKIYKRYQEKIYLLLNKPEKFLTTTKKNCARRIVTELLPDIKIERIYPIGRLDYYSEGIILFTNDGFLTNKLIQSRSNVTKIYIVKIKGIPKKNDLNKLKRGIYLKGGPTGPNNINIIKTTKVNTWLQVILIKGQNQQIRNMFWRINHPVMRIIRTHFASISINGLKKGKFRFLTKSEIIKLKKQYY